jgi:hypothetical protein
MLAQIAYICCAVTSGVAAVLLLRSFSTTKSRLLLWSGLCFVGLMLENVVIFLDLVVTGPHIDLRIVRLALGLAGLMCLLFGLIWEAEK